MQEKANIQTSTLRVPKNILEEIKINGYKNTEILWPLRVALSLSPASPDVFDIMAVLGKQESLSRIKSCVDFLMGKL
jgi:glutamyl/glutaminyl-tRNA synthetase